MKRIKLFDQFNEGKKPYDGEGLPDKLDFSGDDEEYDEKYDSNAIARKADIAEAEKRGLKQLTDFTIGKEVIWFSTHRDHRPEKQESKVEIAGKPIGEDQNSRVMIKHVIEYQKDGQTQRKIKDGGAVRCDELWEKK